jgi:YggT family protein
MGVAVYRAISMVLFIYEWILVARVLMSWLPVSRDNRLVDVLYAVTEPVLSPIRNMISKSSLFNNSMLSMFDFSPIIAFLLIGVIRNILMSIFRIFLY